MEYIEAKSIVSKVKNNGWFGIDYNMNIYRGCNHKCIYCDSRSSCYNNPDFDNVKIKSNALDIIYKELKSKRTLGVIGTGAMSDPYNSFEKEYKLTRKSLEFIDKFHFGISIDTKGTLVTRDIDILKNISIHSPVIVKITITTTDDKLSKIIEPNAPLPSERFKAIKLLSDNNIFVGILYTPILPFINDTKQDVINMVKMASSYNAKFIYTYFGVTLRDNQRDYFYTKLDTHFPGIKLKYMKNFRNKYVCTSLNRNILWRTFKDECIKYKILYKMEDIVYEYKEKYTNIQNQISLFNTK